MARAFHPVLCAIVVLVGLTLTHAAAAGSAKEADHRASNSFTLLTTAGPAQAAPRGQSNGVGIGPSKPVVSNPYNVPLLQNAGSLRTGR